MNKHVDEVCSCYCQFSSFLRFYRAEFFQRFLRSQSGNLGCPGVCARNFIADTVPENVLFCTVISANVREHLIPRCMTVYSHRIYYWSTRCNSHSTLLDYNIVKFSFPCSRKSFVRLISVSE